MEISCDVNVSNGEGGLTMYMSENAHYDVAIRKNKATYEAVLKLNVGNIKHVEKTIPLKGGSARLIVRADSYNYNFFVSDGHEETYLGTGLTKYLSSEVDEGFTGVLTALYTINGTSKFINYRCIYS